MINPITERARSLRNMPTEAEKKLWHHIRANQLGIKFRRQYPIGPYFVDFISKERKLIIELDGGQHTAQIQYDNARTAFLNKNGYTVLRFWNNDVLENIAGIVHRITEHLDPVIQKR